MTLVRFSDPLSDLTKLFDDLWTPTKSTFDRDFFHPQIFNRSMPSVEVYETDNTHVIEVAAPGLNRDNLKASLEDKTLTLSYTNEKTEGGRRSFNSFQRAWSVPEGTVAEDINAEYKDGILEVTVKKPEQEVLPAKEIKIS